MNNGCICCTVRGDLIRILSKLFRRGTALDGIIIETTGLADPGPVAQTFFMDESIKEFARLDGIVTLIDCKHIEQHLDEEKPEGAENEAVEQVAFADRLLLNKTDLAADDAAIAHVESRLREINKYAPITRCENAAVAMEEVLNIRAFELARVLEMDPDFLGDGEHAHDETVYSVGFERPGDLNMERTNTWIAKLLQEKGVDIYRMKVGAARPGACHREAASLGPPLRARCAERYSPKHSQASLRLVGWVCAQGVLSMTGCADRYVYQGVHMLFTGEVLTPWGDAPRINRLIFIGKNLNREELEKGFEMCLDTAE